MGHEECNIAAPIYVLALDNQYTQVHSPGKLRIVNQSMELEGLNKIYISLDSYKDIYDHWTGLTGLGWWTGVVAGQDPQVVCKYNNSNLY